MKKVIDQEKKAIHLVMVTLLAMAVVFMAGIPVIGSLLPY